MRIHMAIWHHGAPHNIASKRPACIKPQCARTWGCKMWSKRFGCDGVALKSSPNPSSVCGAALSRFVATVLHEDRDWQENFLQSVARVAHIALQ